MNTTTNNTPNTYPEAAVPADADPADVHNPEGAALGPRALYGEVLMPGALRTLLGNPGAIAGPMELLQAAKAAADAWNAFLADIDRLAGEGRNVEALRAIPEALPEFSRLAAAVARMGL